MSAAPSSYAQVTFPDLPGWADDDQMRAFEALAKSCRRIRAIVASGSRQFEIERPAARDLHALCGVVADAKITNTGDARRFFETWFVPHRVVHQGPEGLLTGYYEAELNGARAPGGRFTTPVLRRPADLVTVVEETKRGTVGTAHTHMRQTAAGLVPFFTRQEIDTGALAGRGLEMLYLEHPVDLFFLQVQGSGIVKLPDGTSVRLAYDGKNGHPYTSVGRVLIDRGIIDAGRMSLQSLGDWLRQAGDQGRDVMWQNRSYVFFKELRGASDPVGSLDIPLSPGRSLAVDPSHHALGLPIYVSSPTLTHATPAGGFHRLMIAQDVGSAIKGPERGDIYFGSGRAAEKTAGVTRHAGRLFVLLPKAAAGLATSSTKPRK